MNTFEDCIRVGDDDAGTLCICACIVFMGKVTANFEVTHPGGVSRHRVATTSQKDIARRTVESDLGIQ